MRYVDAAQAWAVAHPALVALISYQLVCLMVAALPARAQKVPLVGHVLAFFDWVSYLVHRDMPGTLQIPLVQGVLVDALMKALSGTRPPSDPPAGGAGGDDSKPVPSVVVAPPYDRMIARAWFLLAPALVGLLLVGCSGAQSGRWETDTRGGAALTAHGVDAVDALLATRFRQDAARAGADVERLTAEYQPAVDARNIARASLVALQAALDTYDVTRSPRDRCAVVRWARAAAGDVRAYVGVLQAAHVQVQPDALEGADALERSADAMGAQCTADGGV